MDVEELFRQKLENAEVIPGESLNTELMHKLSRKEFLHFIPSRFNIYYLGLIAAGLITSGLLLLSGLRDEKKQDTPVIENNSEILNIPQSKPIINSTKSGESGKISPRSVVKENPVENKTSEKPAVSMPREDNVPAGINGSISKDIVLLDKTQSDLRRSSSQGSHALFVPSALSGCAPFKVKFENLAYSYSSFSWNFGDGGRSDKAEPEYIYDSEGEYTVVLQASDANGKVSSWTVPIRVNPRPKAGFEISPENAVLPADDIRFSNYSSGAAHYSWDFGDGTTSTVFEPVHKYSGYGKYDIRLIAVSDKGCSDTLLIKNPFSGSQFFVNVPNAFIPNSQGPSGGFYSVTSDEHAEIFHPVCSGVTEFQMRIFSKTGLLVFESNDLSIGWDGYFKGQLCNPGVYIWKIRGRFSNGESFTKNGDVTLLKK